MSRHVEPQVTTEDVCTNCSRLWKPTYFGVDRTNRCSYCGCKTSRERVTARAVLQAEPTHGWSPSTDWLMRRSA